MITVQLDNSNPVAFFLSLMKMIRVDILERFTLPFFDISYWDFCIAMAAASIVVAGCVAVVRIGGLRTGREARRFAARQYQPRDSHTTNEKG